MPLKPISTLPQPPRYQVSPPGFFARHDGKKVIEQGELTTVLNTGSQLIAADSQAEVDAEIARLKLAPLPKTPVQLAADYFGTLPVEVQQQFAPVMQAVSAVPKIEDKIKAVEAVTVPDSLAAAKQTLIYILSGKTPAPAPSPNAAPTPASP